MTVNPINLMLFLVAVVGACASLRHSFVVADGDGNDDDDDDGNDGGGNDGDDDNGDDDNGDDGDGNDGDDNGDGNDGDDDDGDDDDGNDDGEVANDNDDGNDDGYDQAINNFILVSIFGNHAQTHRLFKEGMSASKESPPPLHLTSFQCIMIESRL